jgi:hypothetical protein
VHESELENSLQGIENGHLAFGCGISGDFNFVGFRHDRGGGLFSIRLEYGQLRSKRSSRKSFRRKVSFISECEFKNARISVGIVIFNISEH